MKPLCAIACGGTGGHLFPGVTIAEELLRRSCDVLLLVSPKEIDQQAVQSLRGLQVATLPAVGLDRGRVLPFLVGFGKSWQVSHRLFRERRPQLVLAMGGFTSAPPVLAGKVCGAATFLHESNAVPGRANRWLAHVVHQGFIGFPSAASRLRHPNVLLTGTPVRSEFQPFDADAARVALGLQAQRPVLLVMGGSQGASGINSLVLQSLPEITAALPNVQFLHLTGVAEAAKVQAAYAELKLKAVVRPFLTEMELALASATVAVSRAGASSLAELAAMRLPSILIPYPTAADNHQFFNARVFADSGAAFLLEQRPATAASLAAAVIRLARDEPAHRVMAEALARWHAPQAAGLIAEHMLRLMDALDYGQWEALKKPAPAAPPRPRWQSVSA